MLEIGIIITILLIVIIWGSAIFIDRKSEHKPKKPDLVDTEEKRNSDYLL